MVVRPVKWRALYSGFLTAYEGRKDKKMAPSPRQPAFFPGRAAIDSYGNGGFRFAEMSHRGALMCLPSGIHGWDINSIGDLTSQRLARVFDEQSAISLLLLGTGAKQVFPDVTIFQALGDAGIGIEVMDTGAAARTYNVLLAEGRRVAAALLAVD